MMQQSPVHREDRRFIPAMLRAGRGEGSTDLANQRALRPQLTCASPERGHLRGNISVVSGRSYDNSMEVLRDTGHAKMDASPRSQRAMKVKDRACVAANAQGRRIRFRNRPGFGRHLGDFGQQILSYPGGRIVSRPTCRVESTFISYYSLCCSDFPCQSFTITCGIVFSFRVLRFTCYIGRR
jgi:hypothetical protein